MNTTHARRTALALAASALLATGTLAATPAATADPAPSSAESLAAKRAIDAIVPTDAAGVIDSIAAANAVLKQLGITPFTPTAGVCTDFTFSPAVGGALPGPTTPLVGDLTLLRKDLNVVKKGQVMFGFVPTGITADSNDKSGMRVAWFNVNTFQGSIGDPMKGITDVILDAVDARLTENGIPPAAGKLATAPLRTALNTVPQAGVRGSLVDTEAGTVLAAMYGTVSKGDATCFFFPSLGVVTAN